MSKVDDRYEELHSFNEKRGYFFGPDVTFTKDLIQSLINNNERYGYEACPCRLVTGVRSEDLDIICPCDYRDQDILDFGACYCGLYVSKDIVEGKRKLTPIPERRPNKEKRRMIAEEKSKLDTASKLPVWRCTVCGYLCAREEAPEICPICGVAHDRFERF